MEESYKGLKRLRTYKNQIMEAIVYEEDLVKAIANNQTNFLDYPVENPADLIYKQIFPYKWTAPEIPDRKETYLTMTFDVSRAEGGVFNNIVFSIYILVHKDIMRINTGEEFMLRSDYIMEKLEELFHQSSQFGIGRLELIDTGELFISRELPGFYLTFATVDQAKER